MSTFTTEEVRAHQSKESLWVTQGSNVFDVTDFASRHPGGTQVMLQHGGQDVTAVMQDTRFHEHSGAAYLILKKCYIGELQDYKKNGMQQNGSAQQNGKTVHEDTSPLMAMSGWKEEEMVDWSKSLFWQVGKLGSNYQKWVHSPVDKRARIFVTDYMEFMTNTPWYAIPIIWMPIVFFSLYWSVSIFLHQGPILWHTAIGDVNLSVYHVPLFFAAGIFMWTLCEYGIHRFIFHLHPPANSQLLIMIHFLLHGIHHKTPFDPMRLVFPPVLGLSLASGILCMYSWVLPLSAALPLAAGTGFGYVFYDLTHYYVHHGSPSLSHFKKMKTYHVKHHFVHQELGYGISSKLWDYPFGTVLTDNKAQ